MPTLLSALKNILITAFLAAAIAVTAAHAIVIADNFTYAGTNGFAASRALATDFASYPVFESSGFFNSYLQGDIESPGSGSGTLLNSEWILSAGHCWNNTTTNMEFVVSGVAYAVNMESIILHPLWTNAPPPLPSEVVAPSQGWDLALFKLVTPITINPA